MGDVTDYDRDDRPSTAQPPPVHVPGAPSVHDLVIERIRMDRDRGPVGTLEALLLERKAFGLAKYGTVLQLEDTARDARQDLLEELGDAVVYAYRAAETTRDPRSRELFWELVKLSSRAAAMWYQPPIDWSRPDGPPGYPNRVCRMCKRGETPWRYWRTADECHPCAVAERAPS